MQYQYGLAIGHDAACMCAGCDTARLRETIEELRLQLASAHEVIRELGTYAAALEMMQGVAREGKALTNARAFLEQKEVTR